MGEFSALVICCVITGFSVYSSTTFTLESSDLLKLSNSCPSNGGMESSKFNTSREVKITCKDGAVFSYKLEK